MPSKADRAEAARTLGRIKTPAKSKAARENGKKGGRPIGSGKKGGVAKDSESKKPRM